MAEQIEVRIITPARVVYSRPVDCISLPGTNGMMEILPGHVALFSTVMPGELTVTRNGKKEVFACADGIVEVSNDVVTLLVDSARGNMEIDPVAEKALIDEAEDKLKNLSNEDVEQRFAFESQLAAAKARIEVYERTAGEHEATHGFSTVAAPVVEKVGDPNKSDKSDKSASADNPS